MDYPYDMGKALVGGLRLDPRTPLNAHGLEYAKNAKATPLGCLFPESITAPDSATVAYPHPQLHRLERGDLRLGVTTAASRAGRTGAFSTISLYLAENPPVPATFTSTQPWRIASAHTQWFASDGTTFLFFISSRGGTTYKANISANALCMNKGRLILGGVSSSASWFSGSRWVHVMDHWRKHQPKGRSAHDTMTWDASWIVAMEPGGGADDIPYHVALAALGVFGDNEFDQWRSVIDTCIEKGDIVLIPTQYSTTVLAVEPIGKFGSLMVYGSDSISELSPVENRYDEVLHSHVGILSRCAVGGNLKTHVGVDSQYHLIQKNDGADLERINAAEFLTTTGKTIVSLDETFSDFWITDGTRSYIWNGALGGPIDVCPTSLERDATEGLLGYAVNADEGSYVFEVRFIPTNFGVQDWSRVVALIFDAHGLTDIEVKVDSRQSDGLAWEVGPWIPAFMNNYATPTRSGVELRVSLRGNTTLVSPARLSAMEARYLGSGGNVRRGPSPGYLQQTDG